MQTTEETTVRWHPKMRLRCDVYNVYLGVCNHSTQKKNRFNSHQSGCYQMLISISTLTSAVIEFSNFYLMFSQHTATSKSSDYKRFQHHSIILYNVYIYIYVFYLSFFLIFVHMLSSFKVQFVVVCVSMRRKMLLLCKLWSV